MFSSVIKGMIKNLFSSHIAELLLFIEYWMQNADALIHIFFFPLEKEVSEHSVSRGLLSSTKMLAILIG